MLILKGRFVGEEVEEEVQVTVCIECWAIVFIDNIDAHRSWHRRYADS